jgi:hypothetical protein
MVWTQLVAISYYVNFKLHFITCYKYVYICNIFCYLFKRDMVSDNSELFPLCVWSLLFHVICVWAANLKAGWTKLFLLSHQHKTFISVTNNFFYSVCEIWGSLGTEIWLCCCCVMLWNLLDTWQCFRGTCCLLYPETCSDRFVGTSLLNCSLCPRGP